MHTPTDIEALVREANRLRAQAIADALRTAWDGARRLADRIMLRSPLVASRRARPPLTPCTQHPHA